MKDGDNPRRTWLLWCPPALLPLHLHTHTHTHPHAPLPLSPHTHILHTHAFSLDSTHLPPAPHRRFHSSLHTPQPTLRPQPPSPPASRPPFLAARPLRRHRCFCYHNNHVAPRRHEQALLPCQRLAQQNNSAGQSCWTGCVCSEVSVCERLVLLRLGSIPCALMARAAGVRARRVDELKPLTRDRVVIIQRQRRGSSSHQEHGAGRAGF